MQTCARLPVPTSSAAPMAIHTSLRWAPKWSAHWRFPIGCCKKLATDSPMASVEATIMSVIFKVLFQLSESRSDSHDDCLLAPARSPDVGCGVGTGARRLFPHHTLHLLRGEAARASDTL